MDGKLARCISFRLAFQFVAHDFWDFRDSIDQAAEESPQEMAHRGRSRRSVLAALEAVVDRCNGALRLSLQPQGADIPKSRRIKVLSDSSDKRIVIGRLPRLHDEVERGRPGVKSGPIEDGGGSGPKDPKHRFPKMRRPGLLQNVRSLTSCALNRVSNRT